MTAGASSGTGRSIGWTVYTDQALGPLFPSSSPPKICRLRLRWELRRREPARERARQLGIAALGAEMSVACSRLAEGGPPGPPASRAGKIDTAGARGG